MNIIHCADLHLDSPMTSNLDRQKAAERKNELLSTFSSMVEYAEEEGVRAVIIAGDLFDRDRVSASARNIVYGVMAAHPEVLFFYLRGNHDRNGADVDSQGKPSNLRLFGPGWTSYELLEGMKGDGRITISGREFLTAVNEKNNAQLKKNELNLDPRSLNIVVLHGQLSRYGSEGRADEIDLRQLSNRNIDYLALGHIHDFRRGTLPPGGVYCYSGCLEGRGFDETGDHGFVLLDLNTRTRRIRDTFVPFAKRGLYEVEVDITGCMTTVEISERMRQALERAACQESSLVKMILRGEVDVECEKNLDYLEQQFQNSFYYVRVEDQSRLAVDYNRYALEISLKGELIRMIQDKTELTENEKSEIIRCALQALNEEEIRL